MTNSLRILIPTALSLSLLVGCNKADTGEQTTTPTTPEPSTTVGPTLDGPADAERPKLSRAECEAQGGQIVGDMGDGAIHKPDYVCASGKAPAGSIAPGEGEPIASEGEVCCPG